MRSGPEGCLDLLSATKLLQSVELQGETKITASPRPGDTHGEAQDTHSQLGLSVKKVRSLSQTDRFVEIW